MNPKYKRLPLKTRAFLGTFVSSLDSYRSYRIPFRPDIEGLRAVAVTIVVLYHVGLPFLPGALIGVDILFVVSGYLITSLLSREADVQEGLTSSASMAEERGVACRRRLLL